MSLKLNSSGGGSVTLQEPATASNVTLNLPAATGTVLTNTGNQTVAGVIASSSGGFQFPDNSTQNTAATGFGFKNRIINGAMQVWQRGTSFTVSTTTVTYTADRFGIYQPSGTGTITRDTDAPTSFKYSLKAVGAGTDIIQRIESSNVSDLSGATVTVSFWMKQTVSSGSGSISVLLQYANSVDNFSALTVISSQTITPTSSWALYSLTFTNLPSGVTNGLSIDIYPTSSASSSTFYITGVQLEKGSTATAFDFRDYGRELAMCQRYTAALAQGTGAFTMGQATSSSTMFANLRLPVQMRAAPTVTVSSASHFSVTNSGGSQFAAGATNTTDANVNAITMNFTSITSSPLVAGNGTAIFCNNGSALIIASAEL